MSLKILFFARDYQSKLFPLLKSKNYESLFVTLTLKEKKALLKKGITVTACFEEEFNELTNEPINEMDYLITSFVSDRFLGSFNNKERCVILNKEKFFWSKIFDTYQPSAIVNEIVAIELSEVMYIEAKKRDIACWAWMVSPFKDKCFYWLNEPYNARLSNTIFNYTPTKYSIEKAKLYLTNFHEKKSNQLFYTSYLKSRYNLFELLKNIMRLLRGSIMLSLDKNIHNYFKPFYYDISFSKSKISHFFKSVFYKYDKVDKKNDYDLVFYPMHFEPEASILYMSEFFENQVALIRNLSKCLRHDQLLVVKEHPQQLGVLLTHTYRRIRKSLSNVIFVQGEYPTYSLINKAEIVITQTSTAGWEALLLEKPVFVFGKVFYDFHPEINRVTSFDELKEKLRKNHYKKTLNTENTINYIANLWDYCRYGNPYPNADLYSENNLKLIVSELERKVDELATN